MGRLADGENAGRLARNSMKTNLPGIGDCKRTVQGWRRHLPTSANEEQRDIGPIRHSWYEHDSHRTLATNPSYS